MIQPEALAATLRKARELSGGHGASLIDELVELIASDLLQSKDEQESFKQVCAASSPGKKLFVVSWKEPNGVRDERQVLATSQGEAFAWLLGLRPYLMANMGKAEIKVKPFQALNRRI